MNKDVAYRKAAALHNVNPSTRLYRPKGGSAARGRKTALSQITEDLLSNLISNLAEWGYALEKRQILQESGTNVFK